MDILSLTITMDWQNGVIVDKTLDNSVAEIDLKDNVDEIQVNFESQTNVDEICCLICSKVLKNKESLRKHQIELVTFVTKCSVVKVHLTVTPGHIPARNAMSAHIVTKDSF